MKRSCQVHDNERVYIYCYFLQCEINHHTCTCTQALRKEAGDAVFFFHIYIKLNQPSQKESRDINLRRNETQHVSVKSVKMNVAHICVLMSDKNTTEFQEISVNNIFLFNCDCPSTRLSQSECHEVVQKIKKGITILMTSFQRILKENKTELNV